MSSSTLTDPAARRLAEHRALHASAVVGKRGPASFVWGDFVTEAGTRVPGAPGEWAPSPAGQAGLEVHAAKADGIRIGGQIVDGTAVLYARPEDGPTVAEFPDGAEGVIFSYDGSKHALQVWNPASEWTRRHGGISAFDYDPSWVVAADVTLIDSPRTVAISHHRDPRPVDVAVVAEIRFERDGTEHVLLGTATVPGVDGVTVLFTDTTSGPESYAAGRIVTLPRRVSGRAELDFNYATLLPCAFSLAWNCPIPPAENALPIAVRAGEKHAVDHDGRDLL